MGALVGAAEGDAVVAAFEGAKEGLQLKVHW
jgi:hypothetical protein